MQDGKKIAFYTLGCKLNFSETSGIARDFEERGYARVDWDDNPDVFVLNTCSVTENADKKCRRIVAQLKSKSPHSFVAVIGCYAQLKPKEISEIPGVNIVLGASEKFNLPDYVENIDATADTVVANSPIKDVRDFIPSFSKGDRTRSFMKIQDGCDYFCSFCTIPLARGRSRNSSVENTVIEAKKIAATDVREVVLTGVNIGDFGQGKGENFHDLITQLDHIEGIERFRISSIEPNLLSNDIIQMVANSNRFVPHFHIPLQSGSDRILKMMRRRYDTSLYADRINSIKSLMPDCCIGVDVIVGYPGETEEDFNQTLNFLKDLPVSYLHVFTYSERNNTVAIRSNDVVPMKTRHERSKQLRILSDKKKRAFYESQVNKVKTVLWEVSNENDEITGFTENYVKVKMKNGSGLENKLQQISIGKISYDLIAQAEPVNQTIEETISI